MWAWLRNQPAFWWDRLVSSDAGHIRLQFAIRATASVALTFGAIDALTHATRLPMAMIVMGIIESLFASVAVRDPSPAKQRVTLLLTPLPAAAALTLGTVLAPWRAVGDASFLAIIFAATYARRFGPRAMAMGMLAYISFFLGLYLHLPIAQLRYQMFALLIGTASAYAVRFVLFRDHPQRTLEHVLAAFYERVDAIAAAIDAALTAGGWDGRNRRALRRSLIQLNEIALAVEGQINSPAEGRSTFALRLFDLEVAAGRLADTAMRSLPRPPDRAALRRALDRVRSELRGGRPSLAAPPLPGPMGRAVGEVEGALRAMPAPDHEADATVSPQPASGGAKPGAEQGRLLPMTRSAIQVTLACALAIVPGELLSPTRWYWAVITVFVMFTGTQSRGDVLAKGVQRAAGTLAGVGAGILVATAVSGKYALSIGLIMGCVFLAFYLLQAAYGLMVFWITILISLLYGLLGVFTPSLLLLRVEETGIGAVLGVLVAQFVLPTSSRFTFVAAASAFLQAVGDLIGRAVQSDDRDLTEKAREVDRRFHQLRAAGRPLTVGVAGAFASTEARRWVRAFLACDRYARDLAAASRTEEPTQECRDLAARITARIGRIVTALDHGRTGPTSGAGDPADWKEPMNGGRESTMLHALGGIGIATRLLARGVGVAVDPEEGGG